MVYIIVIVIIIIPMGSYKNKQSKRVENMGRTAGQVFADNRIDGRLFGLTHGANSLRKTHQQTQIVDVLTR